MVSQKHVCADLVQHALEYRDTLRIERRTANRHKHFPQIETSPARAIILRVASAGLLPIAENARDYRFVREAQNGGFA
jgi:hypothetical protein